MSADLITQQLQELKESLAEEKNNVLSGSEYDYINANPSPTSVFNSIDIPSIVATPSSLNDLRAKLVLLDSTIGQFKEPIELDAVRDEWYRAIDNLLEEIGPANVGGRRRKTKKHRSNKRKMKVGSKHRRRFVTRKFAMGGRRRTIKKKPKMSGKRKSRK